MSVIKDVSKTIVNVFSKQFYFFASLASIIGLIIVFFKEDWAVLVALSFFCFLLIIFTTYLIFSLYKILELKQSEHQNRSSFIKYEAIDKNKIIYETYKLIQVKKPVLLEMDYNFKWTGTHLPKISSDLQLVENIVDEQNPSKYDKAILKFKKPVYYNQNIVVHFKAELDDTDNVSQPFLESRVIYEIDVIHYRIILKNKNSEFNENAILQRCKIDSSFRNDFQKIKEIPFDIVTKSYEYHLLNPEIGYYYRISWNK